MSPRRIAALLAGPVALALAGPAGAAGCNGIVNWFVWGCAGWDNNNGPQYPYYSKKVVTLPAQGTQVVDRNGAKFAVRGGVYYPIISDNGGGIVSDHGGAFRVWAQ